MTAAQVIEEICKLTPEEQEKVVKFVNRVPNQETIDAMNEPIDKSRSFKSAEELFAALDKEC